MTELSTAIAELNRRRLRALGPLMLVLHTLHVIFFHVPAAARATLSADTLRWRESLTLVHAVTLPFVLVLALLAYRVRRPSWSALLGPATALLYVLHGALVAGIDQLVSSNISAYIGYCIGIAVIVSLPPRVLIVVYALGAVTLLAGIATFQPIATARITNLPTSVTVALVSIAIGWILDSGRRREISQRTTIDRQRDELAALNHSLEERVREQVREIVTRADEVQRLNAQLQMQVRERSGELSLALSRLARQRESDGTLASGLVLAGRFTVHEPIGRGGMGTVYAGLDRSTGRRVAIKVIQASSTSQLEAMRRFIREAGAAATVSHPAVVRTLHVDVSDDGLLFQVQELVDGETLAGRDEGEPWPLAAAARVGAVLCEALAAAHALGVVHRDVKPDNIMLTTEAPGLKLLDFGIAKLGDAVLVRDGYTTEARMIVGTPGYMAPEQAAGTAGVGDRADIYAVGVLLHQLVTRPPHDLAIEPPGLPPALATLVRRCLADAPRMRPPASELAQALAHFADCAGMPPLPALAPTLLGHRHLMGPPSEAMIPTSPQRRSPA